MQEYGIGGTEVKGDASEAITEIPQNRTLMVEKLTGDPPVKPGLVEGLTTIDDVFKHFNPSIEVDFENSDGATKKEKLSFKGLSDFGVKGITAQSEFLKDMTSQQEQFFQIIKQLKSNKLLRKTLENADTKEAMINVLFSLIREIEEN